MEILMQNSFSRDPAGERWNAPALPYRVAAKRE